MPCQLWVCKKPQSASNAHAGFRSCTRLSYMCCGRAEHSAGHPSWRALGPGLAVRRSAPAVDRPVAAQCSATGPTQCVQR